MADQESKVPENVPGAFYVDDQCIACDACVTEAPGFFQMNDEEGYAFVFKQPSNKNDIETCMNALYACPVDAIGDDAAN